MSTWTEPSRELMETFLRERPAAWGLEGEAADELAEDLRRHVHEELERSHVEVVSRDVLERILLGISGPELTSKTAKPESKPEVSSRHQTSTPVFLRNDSASNVTSAAVVIWRWICGGAYLFAALLAPVVAVVFEAGWHPMAVSLFDPLPTWLHVVLVGLVPVATFLAWRLRNDKLSDRALPLTALCGGFALTVSAYYAIAFLPTVPIALVGVVIWLLGLLPLAPLSATIALWFARRRLWRRPAAEKLRGYWWTGFAVGFALLVVAELPGWTTRIGVHQAESSQPEEASRGIQFLRDAGSDDRLLRICFETGSYSDIPGWVCAWFRNEANITGRPGRRQISHESANALADLYFRVTGRSLSEEVPPRRAEFGRAGWDAAQGGTQVGHRISRLELMESRLDGHLNTASGLGYQEWTLKFRNENSAAREARCQIQLPPGGSVSRVTLWVNDEPQEAAFNAVAQVRAAYREVAIVQRRDPVLVTSTGTDRVLVQCFPVPADRGTLQIRLGVTSPLQNGRLWLPAIIERNFDFASDLAHHFWLQSDAPFSWPALSATSTKIKEVEALTAKIFPDEWDRENGFLTFQQVPAPKVWTEDPFAEQATRYLVRTFQDKASNAASQLLFVVDGSAALASLAKRLADVLGDVPNSRILLAGDTVQEVSASALAAAKFSGGANNMDALLQAEAEAMKKPGLVIVWFHGPQPVDLQKAETNKQQLEKGRASAPIYDVSLVLGSDRIAEMLLRYNVLRPSPRFVDLAQELPVWLNALASGTAGPAPVYERAAEAPADGVKVWDHLARHWAAQEVWEHRAGDAPAADKVALAAKYQLVTPWSGAVVLERTEDYVKHGLKQIDPATAPFIPPVPEPSTFVCLLLGWGLLLRRRRC